MGKKRLAILGSTGSIGCSTLEIVRQFPEAFEVFCLVAHTSIQKLRKQVLEFQPKYCVVTGGMSKSQLHELSSGPGTTAWLSEEEAVLELVQDPQVDAVVAAIVGMAGLRSVHAAIAAKKSVLLANKESLVCAGELLTNLLSHNETTSRQLIPLDSEHSAIFQLLEGAGRSDPEKLILTASGGPFLKTPISDFGSITPEMAVKHPRWNMGAKISVDSASMVNKALELIEARWLFNTHHSKIEVLVHPESIIHSLVEFKDGVQLAQLSVPDMKGAIAFGMQYPDSRLPNVMNKLNLAELRSLHFESLDEEKFPAVSIARQTLDAGGAAPAVFNIANELAVSRFLAGKIGFPDIMHYIESSLESFGTERYDSIDDLFDLKNRIESHTL